jgi:hypothetical protein
VPVDNEASTLLGGRYLLGESFASGGMGSVHLGRVVGAGGFSRVVAIKRLFPALAADRSFREMLLDEARFASRIRHPNVVPVLDVVEEASDLYVVMEYVHGISLARLVEQLGGRAIPLPIVLGIAEGVLHGLHAAHEARGEDGIPLGIVHRDVSPQNILVGADGVPRVIDFGIAKAATRIQVTDPGVLKGKARYMAPEQLLRESVSREADLYSAAIVLWEMLANRTLFPGEGFADRIGHVDERPPAPLESRRDVNDPQLDAIVIRALARDPAHRYPNADAMAAALRQGRATASSVEIARWIATTGAADDLEISEERVRLLERVPAVTAIQAAETPRPGEPRPRRRGALFVWLAAAVMVAVGVFFGARTFGRSPAAPSATVASIAAADADADLSTAPSASTTVVASASAPPPSASVASSVPAPKTTGKPARHAAKSQCDPPYTVDSNGFKHYNRNCF